MIQRERETERQEMTEREGERQEMERGTVRDRMMERVRGGETERQ